MGLFDTLLGGGSETTSGSSSSTQTSTPAPRDSDQQMFWDKFMKLVFPAEELYAEKQQQIDDIKREMSGLEIGSIGGIKTYTDNLGRLAREKDKLERELGNIDYNPPGIADRISNMIGNVTGVPQSGGQQAGGLENLFNQRADASSTADNLLGANVGDNAATLLANLRSQYDDKNAANTLYGQTMGGVGDRYKEGLTTNTNQWNADTNPVMDAVRPLATSGPTNIKFGDFSMPFTTGSQAAARNRLGNLNTERLGINNELNTGIRDTDSGQASILNTIANQNAANNMDYGDRAFTQNNAVANLMNEISNRNLPGNSILEFLKFMGGQTGADTALNYGIPTIETTGSASNSVDSNLGLVDIGLGVAGAASPYFTNKF